ncbi:unnamed protein product [Amoebophrya sp. A25]|nr:unnamed protein product [Amoebophrya sp. A25]|eukprot:GSA25T00014252001.1
MNKEMLMSGRPIMDMASPSTTRRSASAAPRRSDNTTSASSSSVPRSRSNTSSEDKKVVGLVNPRFFCFYNSLLQVLYHTDEFREYCVEGSARTEMQRAAARSESIPLDEKLAKKLQVQERLRNSNRGQQPVVRVQEDLGRIFAAMSKTRNGGSLRPDDILVKKLFQGRNHHRLMQDSHELFNRLMARSHDEVCPKADRRSEIEKHSSGPYKFFGGFLQQSVMCSSCKKASTRTDPVMEISLSFPIENQRGGNQRSNMFNFRGQQQHQGRGGGGGQVHVEDLLRHYFKREQLTGANKYLCSFCKTKQNASKFQEIHQAPRRLVLHLKQYDDCGRKVNKRITLPPALELSQFTTSPDSQCEYHLYATLHHSGATTQDGHYYSFAKLPDGSNRKKWYCFDDSHVSESSYERATNFNGGGRGMFSTMTGPYMAFYELVRGEPRNLLKEERKREKGAASAAQSEVGNEPKSKKMKKKEAREKEMIQKARQDAASSSTSSSLSKPGEVEVLPKRKSESTLEVTTSTNADSSQQDVSSSASVATSATPGTKKNMREPPSEVKMPSFDTSLGLAEASHPFLNHKKKVVDRPTPTTSSSSTSSLSTNDVLVPAPTPVTTFVTCSSSSSSSYTSPQHAQTSCNSSKQDALTPSTSSGSSPTASPCSVTSAEEVALTLVSQAKDVFPKSNKCEMSTSVSSCTTNTSKSSLQLPLGRSSNDRSSTTGAKVSVVAAATTSSSGDEQRSSSPTDTSKTVIAADDERKGSSGRPKKKRRKSDPLRELRRQLAEAQDTKDDGESGAAVPQVRPDAVIIPVETTTSPLDDAAANEFTKAKRKKKKKSQKRSTTETGGEQDQSKVIGEDVDELREPPTKQPRLVTAIAISTPCPPSTSYCSEGTSSAEMTAPQQTPSPSPIVTEQEEQVDAKRGSSSSHAAEPNIDHNLTSTTIPTAKSKKVKKSDMAFRKRKSESCVTQYGAAAVSAWSDSEDEKGPQKGKNLSSQFMAAQRALQPNVQQRDAQDLEYDQGKAKHKVKKAASQSETNFAKNSRQMFDAAGKAKFFPADSSNTGNDHGSDGGKRGKGRKDGWSGGKGKGHGKGKGKDHKGKGKNGKNGKGKGKGKGKAGKNIHARKPW